MKPSKPSNPPLCVDLDGTLIRSDILWESALALLRSNPIYMLVLPFWLLRGKSVLKSEIANRADIDVTRLPYRSEVTELLRQRSAHGAQLVLCTASHVKYAQQVADHIGQFSDVIATDSGQNIRGKNKADILCEKFGAGSFDYLGDATIDIPVWEKARHAMVIGPNDGLTRKLLRKKITFDKVNTTQPTFRDYVRALRPHQWVKNFLLFVPILAGHKITDTTLLLDNIAAFIVFCLAAASTYLVNDLFDLEADRLHSTKKHRPFAAGAIPISVGFITAPILMLVSIGIATQLPPDFLPILLLYYTTTLAYSISLKKVVVIDVMILASLYTLRIIAGGAATSVTPSFWLLAFSMFLFLSLAIAKRSAELFVKKHAGEHATVRRQYNVADIPALMMLGTSSGLVAVLVLALYVNSEQVNLQYPNPEMIWLICPIMLFWVARLWLITSRAELNEDPVVFALKDRASQIVGLLCVLVVSLAIW